MNENLISELIRALKNDPQETPRLHDLFRISCRHQFDTPTIQVNAQTLPRPCEVESELKNILIATINPVSIVKLDKDGVTDVLGSETWIAFMEPDFQSRDKGQRPTITAATPNEAIEMAIQHAESAMQNHLYTQARKISRQITEAELASVSFNRDSTPINRTEQT